MQCNNIEPWIYPGPTSPDALRAAGVDDDKARAAAAAVLGTDTQEGFATRADIAAVRADFEQLRIATKADLAQLESRLIRWNVGTVIAMTAVFAAIVKLL